MSRAAAGFGMTGYPFHEATETPAVERRSRHAPERGGQRLPFAIAAGPEYRGLPDRAIR